MDETYILQCDWDSHIKITDSVDGHEDVLEFYQNATGTIRLIDYFTNQNDGTVEFWWRVSDVYKQSDFQLWGNGGGRNAITLDIHTDKLYYYLGKGINKNIRLHVIWVLPMNAICLWLKI